MPIPPQLNPSQCGYGLYQYDTPGVTVQQGSNNLTVGYVMAVLRCACGRTEINIHANPGPWYFNSTVKTAVRDFQAFFGLTVDGIVGPQTRPVLNWAAQGFPV